MRLQVAHWLQVASAAAAGVLQPEEASDSIFSVYQWATRSKVELQYEALGRSSRRRRSSRRSAFLDRFDGFSYVDGGFEGRKPVRPAESLMMTGEASSADEARRVADDAAMPRPSRRMTRRRMQQQHRDAHELAQPNAAASSVSYFFGSAAGKAVPMPSHEAGTTAAEKMPRGQTTLPDVYGDGGAGTRPLPAGAGGKPLPPSDTLNTMAQMAGAIANFIVTLVDMSCTLFIQMLKKSVVGASPVAAADKTGLGNIEYLQPYGWDPYGPGTSEDAYQQSRPETATCHYLQQTWQRQCAARPETVGLLPISSDWKNGASLLQLAEGLGGSASSDAAAAAASPVESPVEEETDSQMLYERGVAALPSSLRSWLEAMPSLTTDQKQSWYAGVAGGGRPQAPAEPARASAAQPPATSGFRLMGTLNAGMMGLGAALSNGPDLYDPQGPNGPEPVAQTTGPEKCYRLLNSWIYKCAVSPM